MLAAPWRLHGAYATRPNATDAGVSSPP
jgi:hypothetical protein